MIRQVPLKQSNYLLVGSGNLARHLGHYFDLLAIPITKWSRNNSEKFNSFYNVSCPTKRLEKSLENCSHVLVAIADSDLEYFCSKLPKDKIIVHFSGALSLGKIAYGAHPLMTFSHNMYSLEDYKKIPFIIEKNLSNYKFKDLMPGLSNPNYTIEPNKKPLYHSLCVFSGNFTNMLWREVAKSIEKEVGIPFQALYPYMQATIDNIKENPLDSLTGPLKRNDLNTIKNNKQALEALKLDNVYQEFVELQRTHCQEVINLC